MPSIYDHELISEILLQLHHSILTIENRFLPVKSVSDLTDSDHGQEKLDALCMQLIAIGESLKKLDKLTDGKLLSRYSDIEWKKAMGMRDVITHHYFDINAEIVFSVCNGELKEMRPVIERIIKEF